MALTLKKTKSPAAEDQVDGATPAPVPSQAPSAGAGSVWESASKPSAFLVPRYITEKRALAKTIRSVMYSLLALLGVMVLATSGVFLWAQSAVSAADEAKGAQDRAQQEVRALNPIADYYDGLSARKTETQTLLSTDVLHAELLKLVRNAMPAGAVLESYTTSFGAPCPSPNPFSAAQAIGCINGAMTASDPSRASTELIDSFYKDKSLTDVTNDMFVKSVADEAVSFSVNISLGALSLRYIDKESFDPNTLATDPNQADTTGGTP